MISSLYLTGKVITLSKLLDKGVYRHKLGHEKQRIVSIKMGDSEAKAGKPFKQRKSFGKPYF